MSDRQPVKEAENRPHVVREQQHEPERQRPERRELSELRGYDPLAQWTSRVGDHSSARFHAARLWQVSSSPSTSTRASLVQLQRKFGNRYVQRVMEVYRSGGGNREVPPDVEQAILRAQGGGKSLDRDVRIQMETAFGANFSAVRIHTGKEADGLNRALQARAFTTGQDIFFRQGEYSPTHPTGQELLAHELTHVVQQRAGQVQGGPRLQAKLEVGAPDDAYEREADRVADAVMRMSEPKERSRQVSPEYKELQRQPEEEDDLVQRAADPETLRRTPFSPFSMAEGKIVEEDEAQIQTKTAAGAATTADPVSSAKVEAVLQRSGTPLPGKERSFMESRFGYDFGQVRVHADEPAAQAAQAVNARAFTKGASVVFARGQYSPDSPAGSRLLAHELTHVVQQGKASPLTTAELPGAQSRPEVEKQDRNPILRRVKWSTAKDTGRDSFPWGSGPKGDVCEVETDAGTKINAWKPHDGSTYWCHGYTFEGSTASGGPFSIWGEDVSTVLIDDGWRFVPDSKDSKVEDILVFGADPVAHTGIIRSVVKTPGPVITVIEDQSKLQSKWGQLPLNTKTWKENRDQYGTYTVYSK